MKGQPPPPPWKRKKWLILFFFALVGSYWLIVHMPADSRRMNKNAPAATQSLNAPSPGEVPPAGLSPGKGGPSASHGKKAHAPARAQPRSDAEKIFAKLKTFGRLFAVVGLAGFLGGLIEARRWHLVLARVMGRLTRLARLPEIVGLAMPAALCSNPAANSILVSSHAEGQIRTSALIAGGMANSYLAYISHSLRVLLPVVAAIGLPGLIYFGMQFTGGLVILFCVLLWNRWYVSGHGDTPCVDAALTLDPTPRAWPKAFGMAAIRALSLLFRMVCLTVPMMLGVEWLLKNGFFDAWEHFLPDTVAAIFPAEMLSLVAAQMGGLIQGAAVSANLRMEGQINNMQILLAMLVGSAVGAPIRTLRRNLPSAMGIFPLPIALTIVVGMQLSRFLVTLAGIAGVIALMTYSK